VDSVFRSSRGCLFRPFPFLLCLPFCPPLPSTLPFFALLRGNDYQSSPLEARPASTSPPFVSSHPPLPNRHVFHPYPELHPPRGFGDYLLIVFLLKTPPFFHLCSLSYVPSSQAFLSAPPLQSDESHDLLLPFLLFSLLWFVMKVMCAFTVTKFCYCPSLFFRAKPFPLLWPSFFFVSVPKQLPAIILSFSMPFFFFFFAPPPSGLSLFFLALPASVFNV